jgi:hypothetical protein
MPEQTEKQKKKSSLEDKIEVIYEILGLHKLDIESMEDRVEKLEVIIKKVKSRIGI